MAFAWRAANFSYLQYSQICAKAVRSALKQEQRLVAQKREEQGLKFAKWANGKQGELTAVAAEVPKSA
ncbi:hypothetical protein K493DRAFT_346227 [Basidiobolus meristosporus CBS 931.73]|uniref:Mitochondrial ATP synthase epsilon chain domain-containing protein n=1 Tax=Basidiobolus meristosporus CBS 931.73 TaxID=1314790 RepID=A0A1Y1YZC0_9FUNG|nr:hypothetical protein K493DRAFT_346227 [Basidiobolus meristosporus CBS 931.73]|eukprot:ORY03388.1 hypothetical protein K493DRAFT_346227 [Basidiobolus meristosporus CBS 931.73]